MLANEIGSIQSFPTLGAVNRNSVREFQLPRATPDESRTGVQQGLNIKARLIGSFAFDLFARLRIRVSITDRKKRSSSTYAETRVRIRQKMAVILIENSDSLAIEFRVGVQSARGGRAATGREYRPAGEQDSDQGTAIKREKCLARGREDRAILIQKLRSHSIRAAVAYRT